MEYEANCGVKMMRCWEGEKRSGEWPVCFGRGEMVLVRIVWGNILFYVSELEK